MGTKRERVVYWVTTGIVATVMVVSALNFAFNPTMQAAFAHLGLPAWFRTELTIAKLLGGAVLLLPRIPDVVWKFAYAGIAITISSACIAHLASGDGILRGIEPLIFLGCLLVSLIYRRRVRAG